MRINKNAEKLAKDLGLSEVDAYIMDLKAQLYENCSKLIYSSDQTHEEIAKIVGTSRARITRIANMGENSISLELLIKISSVLSNKTSFKLVV